MQGERYVCVRETGGANDEMVSVDLSNLTAPRRHPTTADSAIAAPTSKIFSIEESADGGENVQLFNLPQTLPLNIGKVTYWTWLNDTTIGVVTDEAVYHWDVKVRDALPAADHDARFRCWRAFAASSSGCRPYSYRGSGTACALPVLELPGEMIAYKMQNQSNAPHVAPDRSRSMPAPLSLLGTVCRMHLLLQYCLSFLQHFWLQPEHEGASVWGVLPVCKTQNH